MNGCDNNFSVPDGSTVVKRDASVGLGFRLFCMDFVKTLANAWEHAMQILHLLPATGMFRLAKLTWS